MRPCQASPDCLHAMCQHCDRPIRPNKWAAADHPGTIVGVLANAVCQTHRKLGDQRHLPPEVVETQTAINRRNVNAFMDRIRGKSKAIRPLKETSRA